MGAPLRTFALPLDQPPSSHCGSSQARQPNLGSDSMFCAAQVCLTPRELDVVRLLVAGLGNTEMAERLGVSRRTVHAHLSNAMAKTGTQTRTQLAVYALRAGLVPLRPLENDG